MRKAKEIAMRFFTAVHYLKILLIAFFVLPPLVVFLLVVSCFKELEIEQKK
jgi:hypothetical protein